MAIKLRQLSSGLAQCHNSVLRNTKNLITTLSNDSHSINVKKQSNKVNRIHIQGSHASASINKIPIKVSRFVTTPSTVKPSRKSSNEKRQGFPRPKLVMSQSSSATKIKNKTNQNTQDLRTLLSKFSVISHLTGCVKSKKDSISHNNNNNHYLHNHIQYHANALLTHNNTQCNLTEKISDNKSKFIVNTISNCYNNKELNKEKDNNNFNTNTHTNEDKDVINMTNNTLQKSSKPKVNHRNLKIQSAFKSLKSIGNAFNSNIPLYQRNQISTEGCHNNNNNNNPNGKVSNVSIYLNHTKKTKHKTSTESVLQKYNYQSKLYTTNQRQQSNSNHSPFKSTTTNGTNNHNHNCSSSSLQLSVFREGNYYKAESKKLSEYIIHNQNNTNQYPKTNLHFYKIGRAIGHGAFGKVNIGLHILTGRIVAIKSFNKDKSLFSKNKIDYEIKLMKKLRNHKNIVKVYEKIEGEKYDCIVMENVSGGNLLSLINKRTKLSEEVSKFIFRQIIEALKYVHSQAIVHRDIKPDNILIDLNNTIKLCDFGVGKEIKPGQLLSDTCGTPAFVAPEILSDNPYDPFLTDIWSSGVVLYSMLSGIFPFKGINDYELHKSIINGKYNKIKHISYECKDLISKILEVNPHHRITIEEILSHPWMKGEDKEPTMNCLFTKAEKIIYSKLHIDYRSRDKREDLLELFTFKNIDTSQENENKNVESKSFIITPYNSKRKKDDDDDLYFEDLDIENEIMKFIPKVYENNRNYEINYNSKVDQGFIINQKKKKLKRQLSSVYNSIDTEIEIKPHTKRKENQKRNESLNRKDTLSTNSNTNTFYIDESLIKTLENFGYKRDYLIKALENNELNYATTAYYLLLNSSID